LSINISVPCYTTLCRRRRTLEVSLPKRAKSAPLHLVVDSRDVKVYGEGEWKVRQHGWTRRRTWRKLHIGVDEASGEIRAATVTTNNYGDGQVLPDLLAQVESKLSQVTGDGGYDDRQCYAVISERGARAVIPPQRGARIWQHGNSKQERHARDENVRGIRRHGRSKWKRESHYHRRSVAETTMFRLKMIFGERVAARGFDGQAAQMLVRCAVLNWMTHLGMPRSYAV
jgi:IS5 family transposase